MSHSVGSEAICFVSLTTTLLLKKCGAKDLGFVVLFNGL